MSLRGTHSTQSQDSSVGVKEKQIIQIFKQVIYPFATETSEEHTQISSGGKETDAHVHRSELDLQYRPMPQM